MRCGVGRGMQGPNGRKGPSNEGESGLLEGTEMNKDKGHNRDEC